MKSCNFPRIATFCAYPHDDMREIGFIGKLTRNSQPSKETERVEI